MILTVDRIIGDIAVLEKEDLSHIEVPLNQLPDGTQEGTVLHFDGESYLFNIDEEAERRKRILEKQSLLFKKSKKD